MSECPRIKKLVVGRCVQFVGWNIDSMEAFDVGEFIENGWENCSLDIH